jgi:D-alanyl-D-alanine dipeptidase
MWKRAEVLKILFLILLFSQKFRPREAWITRSSVYAEATVLDQLRSEPLFKEQPRSNDGNHSRGFSLSVTLSRLRNSFKQWRFRKRFQMSNWHQNESQEEMSFTINATFFSLFCSMNIQNKISKSLVCKKIQ